MHWPDCFKIPFISQRLCEFVRNTEILVFPKPKYIPLVILMC